MSEKGGDFIEALLKQLFTNHYKDVYCYLYHLTHDTSLSEDLTSEVFLEVVKSIASFRGESDVKTWLFSIARHKWFGYLRQKKRQVQTELLSEFYEHSLNDESKEKTPEAQYNEKELRQRIYELLNLESERTKQIVLMRLDGFSFYEIGRRYGISENSARVIDFRAKAKIRQILKKEGLFDE